MKWGLASAGIAGDFLTTDISHDEVDAITSALVGLFFRADEYIALGTISEDISSFQGLRNSTTESWLKFSWGLDKVPENSGREVEFLFHAQPLSAAAG